MQLQKVQQFLFQKIKRKEFIQISLVLILVVISTASVLFAMNSDSIKSVDGIKIVPSNKSEENPYYFIYDLKPGAELKDFAIIVNDTDSKKHVTIYGLDQSDGSTKANFSLKNFSSNNPQIEVGNWINFDGKPSIELDIEANTFKEVAFDLKIPDDAEYKEYDGGIAVSFVTSTTEETNSSITSVFQIVARTYITVSKDPREIAPYVYKPNYNKYIISSVIITITAIILIIIAQLKVFIINPPRK